MAVGCNQSKIAVVLIELFKIKQCRATEQKEWLVHWSNSGPVPKQRKSKQNRREKKEDGKEEKKKERNYTIIIYYIQLRSDLVGLSCV